MEQTGALTMDDIKGSADKFKDTTKFTETTNLLKEMFAQQIGININSTQNINVTEKSNQQDNTGEIKAQDDKQDSTEAPIHPSETSAEPNDPKIETHPTESESAGKIIEENLAETTPVITTPAEVAPANTTTDNNEDKCDKNNPKIENEEDDEEEIIDTKPKGQRSDQEEEEEQKEEGNNEDEYVEDEFKAPWENLEVALTIYNKYYSMSEDKEDFENKHWNLKADILERQADLEINRENTL